jgi:hypothetical protein
MSTTSSTRGVSVRRRSLLAALPLLAMAACAKDEDPQTSGDEIAGPADSGERALPSRVKAGEKIDLSGDGLTGSIVVSSPRTIDPPEGWSSKQVVVTVDIDVITGQLAYSESSFRLVSPAGERTSANTVASDVGLPGKALGSGSLQGAGKARGLVTFDGSDGISDGWLIELDDPSANGTFVWELP